MSHRCINAFEFGGVIYPGGLQVEDDDPILASHADCFAKVEVPPAQRTEVASAAPKETRAPAKKLPAKKAAPTSPFLR